MILTAGKQSSNLILDAIRSEDNNMQLSAIQLVRQIPADEDPARSPACFLNYLPAGRFSY